MPESNDDNNDLKETALHKGVKNATAPAQTVRSMAKPTIRPILTAGVAPAVGQGLEFLHFAAGQLGKMVAQALACDRPGLARPAPAVRPGTARLKACLALNGATEAHPRSHRYRRKCSKRWSNPRGCTTTRGPSTTAGGAQYPATQTPLGA